MAQQESGYLLGKKQRLLSSYSSLLSFCLFNRLDTCCYSNWSHKLCWHLKYIWKWHLIDLCMQVDIHELKMETRRADLKSWEFFKRYSLLTEKKSLLDFKWKDWSNLCHFALVRKVLHDSGFCFKSCLNVPWQTSHRLCCSSLLTLFPISTSWEVWTHLIQEAWHLVWWHQGPENWIWGKLVRPETHSWIWGSVR